MRVFGRGAQLAVAFAMLATAAHAQRYRVLVGIAGTSKMSLIEFSPCIPAETSACGAWINRVIDTSTDSSYGPLPSSATDQTSRNGLVRVWIDRGLLALQTMTPDRRGSSAYKADRLRSPTAVAMTPDARYAFAVLEPRTPGETAMVRMYDFNMKSVIANIGLSERPSGISIVP